MESVDITKIMYLDLGTDLPDLLSMFSFGLISGMAIVIFLHLASYAVFGLMELLNIKDK